ncbi:MAG: hypothetical protein CMC22_09630 [Flavobacteriaceae bacterium]|nr:hypothetical protein [Flavobacteriaceae bacterium]
MAKTLANLVIKNDGLYLEKYYEGYGLDSKSNSFSMAKSIVSQFYLGKPFHGNILKILIRLLKIFNTTQSFLFLLSYCERFIEYALLVKLG